MAGNTVDVKPGPARQVNGPLRAGATIKNMDSVNSVWISSSTNPTPGNGIQITPLGSCTWIADNRQVFACVDSGVITSVLLNISDDANNAVDPVAVASATATELLLKGIPQVYTSDVLVDHVNTQDINTPFGSFLTGPPIINQCIDVSRYASISIILTTLATPLPANSKFGMGVTFFDYTDTQPVTYNVGVPYGVNEYCGVMAVEQSPYPWGANFLGQTLAGWTFPVTGKYLFGNVYNSGNINVTVYGSNRLIPSKLMMTMPTINRSFGVNAALVNGTPVLLAPLDRGPVTSSFNGPISIMGVSSAVPGVFGFLTPTVMGVAQYKVFTPNLAANTRTLLNLQHPFAYVQPFFIPGASAASTVQLDIMGSQ